MSRFEVKQTEKLLKCDGGLKNEMYLTVDAEVSRSVLLTMNGVEVFSGSVISGEQTLKFYIDPPTEAGKACFALTGFGEITAELRVPRKFEVHLVQLSHHDPGYTNVPSHVIDEGVTFLYRALDDMDAREDYGDDDRYRIVIEQTYSLKRFLDTASPVDRERMMNRIRRGDVEVTAFFANLISEILSPEQTLRALYPSEEIARESGVPIIAAEHNDVPGFSWGYCTALCRAGIKMFVPGLPLYYDWGFEGLSSFWNTEEIFGTTRPGAFWWESAEGDRILFYCNNSGCGGERNPTLPKLFDTLEELSREGYAHDVLRWPIQSASRDNSPYIPDFSDFVKEWNEKYAYPHIICSTEGRFYRAFVDALHVELPVYRGGVDGQDYPLGSISQPASSTVSRETHSLYRQAEMLYSLAKDDGLLSDQSTVLHSAMQDMLMADEHAYGYTYPASPAQRTSYWEHGVYAMRANSDAHDVLAKSAASIADRVGSEWDGYRLTVFNTSGLGGVHSIHAPLRDPDNCGTEIRRSEKTGLLRIYQLSNRMQVHPQGGLLDGEFILRDAATGESVPFVIHKVNWDDPGELTGLRAGIAMGSARMGMFEDPRGAALEIHFSAELPPYGYRTFLLVPSDDLRAVRQESCDPDIENEYYRVRITDGRISIVDKQSGRDIFDPESAYKPLSVLVRNGNDKQVSALTVDKITAKSSPVESTITFSGSGDGVYTYTTVITLSSGVDSVSIETKIVKNEKPLQTLFMAFPFAGEGLRYQSVLHEAKPAANLLPGSHSDAIAIQDYVLCESESLIFSSANAPVVFLSSLWDGYVSPAHRCIASAEQHRPLTPDDYRTSHVYSVLSSGNFGTNFFPSQISSATYRFTVAKTRGRSPALLGMDNMSRVATILTDRSRGDLPESFELVDVSGARILALKEAEDGNGFILRLINDSDEYRKISVSMWGKRADICYECDVLERNIRECTENEVTVSPHGLCTLRILPNPKITDKETVI